MQAHKLKLSGSPSEVMRIEENPLFPISWLHKQEYCEYQIFLENIKGIKVAPTKAIVEMRSVHQGVSKL